MLLNPYIETFMKVADLGSFSAAAETLYLSKVSVMNQMNALEARLGVTLFERTHQGVLLTEAGKSFYKNAKKIILSSDNAIEEAKQIGGVISHTIRVGTSMMRPCNTLVELSDKMSADNQAFRFNIVPFNDDVDSLSSMLASLGDKIDCFVSPCGSMDLLMKYNFLPLRPCKCAIAMSKKHPLAKKEVLEWEDLEEESLLLMKRGDSYVLDEMRDDILKNHPSVNIVDFDRYYDVSTFNLCEQQGYLMETLDIWTGLHPSLITIPVNWKYEMPYGIIYSKEPPSIVGKFVDAVDKFTLANSKQ